MNGNRCRSPPKINGNSSTEIKCSSAMSEVQRPDTSRDTNRYKRPESLTKCNRTQNVVQSPDTSRDVNKDRRREAKIIHRSAGSEIQTPGTPCDVYRQPSVSRVENKPNIPERESKAQY